MWFFRRKKAAVMSRSDVLTQADDTEREVREHVEKSQRERHELMSKLRYLELQSEVLARRVLPDEEP